MKALFAALTIGLLQLASSSSNNPTITLDFQANAASGSCASIAACLSNSNASGGYVDNGNGTWSLISANTIRRSSLGLLSEPPRTEAATSIRDLTNAAWTKTNITAAKTATGIEGSTNVASNLMATASNGTVCQAVTASAGYILGAFIKRVSGTGEIDLSVNNGTTWWPVDTTGYAILGITRALDSSYQQAQLLATSSNPTICLRIVTNGDQVAVDFFGLQSNSQFALQYSQFITSPIPTAGSTRNQDVYTPTGNLLSTLRGSASTVIVDFNGMLNTTALNVFNGPNNVDVVPSGGKTNTATAILLDPTNNHAFGASGSSFSTTQWLSGSQVALAYTSGQDFNNSGFLTDPRTSPIGGSGWQYAGRFCYSVDGSGSSFSFNGGTVQTAATFSLSAAITMFNNIGGYVTKLRVYNSRLSNAQLQNLCYVAPVQPTLADDSVAGTNYYVDYSAGKEQTLTLNNGSNYGTETGQLGAPGGTSSGSYSYIRGFSDGLMTRIAILPGDPPGLGIVSETTTERTEINGGYTAGPGPVGRTYARGTTMWVSFSFLWGPNGPNLAHDFLLLNQITHATVGPGLGLLAAISSENVPDTFHWQNNVNNAGISYGSPFRPKRGCWYNIVSQVTFQSSATGLWNVWVNGTQVVNQTNIVTSETSDGNYFKLGLYRAVTGDYQNIWFANVVQGTTNLSAKISSPDPIPAGYTYSSAGTCP